MKCMAAGDSPCPPWASLCPWNQLSWHVCAHSLRYLFPHVRHLICVPRVHALPRSAAVQVGATKGPWGLPALVAVSVNQRPEPCLSKEVSSKCFPFSLQGEVRVCFWPIFVFLSDIIHWCGIFQCIYVVWSHPCWYLNTIGKQMANFELLDQICVCLCLLNSQTVNDGSINIQQRSSLWKSPEQNRPLLPKYALRSTRAKNSSLPLILFWFPLVGRAAVACRQNSLHSSFTFSPLLPTNAQRSVSPNALCPHTGSASLWSLTPSLGSGTGGEEADGALSSSRQLEAALDLASVS